jgi:putative transposase
MEKTTTSAKYNINYHLVWCPKYRRAILTENRVEFLNLLIRTIAQEKGWEILKLKIMPDHLHLFLSAPPTVSPISIVQTLKGTTAREMFLQFPKLKLVIGTAGHVSEETIRRYIQEQESRSSSPA